MFHTPHRPDIFTQDPALYRCLICLVVRYELVRLVLFNQDFIPGDLETGGAVVTGNCAVIIGNHTVMFKEAP